MHPCLYMQRVYHQYSRRYAVRGTVLYDYADMSSSLVSVPIISLLNRSWDFSDAEEWSFLVLTTITFSALDFATAFPALSFPFFCFALFTVESATFFFFLNGPALEPSLLSSSIPFSTPPCTHCLFLRPLIIHLSLLCFHVFVTLSPAASCEANCAACREDSPGVSQTQWQVLQTNASHRRQRSTIVGMVYGLMI